MAAAGINIKKTAEWSEVLTKLTKHLFDGGPP
jgi:hypothetical protein